MRAAGRFDSNLSTRIGVGGSDLDPASRRNFKRTGIAENLPIAVSKSYQTSFLTDSCGKAHLECVKCAGFVNDAGRAAAIAGVHHERSCCDVEISFTLRYVVIVI